MILGCQWLKMFVEYQNGVYERRITNQHSFQFSEINISENHPLNRNKYLFNQVNKMSASKSPFKCLHQTSIIKYANKEQDQELDIHSSIKMGQKGKRKSAQSQGKVVEFLLSKLAVLQEKQRENQNKLVDCIRRLQLDIASKDKTNQSLKDQISILRQELNQLKGLLDQVPKIQSNLIQTSIKKRAELKKLKPSKTQSPLSMASPQSVEKQNWSPYMMETLCSSRHSKKLSQALAKNQESNYDSNLKLAFKLESFMKQSKVAKVNEYYHHHIPSGIFDKNEQQEMDRRPLRLKNSPCTRKEKSKSIGGILKAKIFMK